MAGSSHTPAVNTCYRCGSKNHLANKCENTKGKTCHTCGKMGHFSNVCRSTPKQSNQQVHYIVADDTSYIR